MSRKVVVFDVETQRDLASVGGQSFIEKLGLSVGVAFDVQTTSFYHFAEHEASDMIDLLHEADLVVGFNIRRFDLRVLSAYSHADLLDLPICDLLEDVEQRLGYRVRLDSLARETLGVRKSADGTAALQWWREGRVDLIRDYCQQDVDLTRRLWEYGRAHGHVWHWDRERRQRRPVAVGW